MLRTIRLAPRIAALLLTAASAAGQGPDRVTGKSFATRSEVIAAHGMAATSHPLATQIAIDTLKRGGSAVDAAIAANAALGLMEPTGCGMGGDLFAIVWDAKAKKLHGLNASGRSPRGLTLAQLAAEVDASAKRGAAANNRGARVTDPLIPMTGPLPITVPGCVDGWFELHGRFGKLPMSDVLSPAAAYARDGFPLSELIAYYWAIGCARLADQPNFSSTFAPTGKAPGKGQIHRNPALARTLEIIGAKGRDAFYRGELTEAMDAFFRKNGCHLRKSDFAEHVSEWVMPVSVDYRGYEVWELPPNTQGVAALQMLNLLEAFDLKAMGINSTEYLHVMIESKKIAYEDRALYYADPAFFKNPIDELISKDYASKRRKLLNPTRASQRLDAGNPRLSQGDTIYLCVADKDRNMVSLIQSNYGGFGSGLCPDGLGFCLQNRGALFDLAEGRPNSYAPAKRPFHTIIPGFVTKSGKPWLAFGLMGGDMQPQGHVQVLCNMIDFGMNVQEAGDCARFYHTGSSEPTGTLMRDGGEVALEFGVPAEVQRDLLRKGHKLKYAPGAFGGYQAIMYDQANDVYVGASESRKDGQASGY